jgi:hypothetical protein
MGRKSSIAQLDPEIREAVDRAIREGRATNAEIVALINAMGAQVSESAVTRYARSAREQMKVFREAQEIAKVWVGKLGEDPESDVGRLVTEMLRTVAFQQLGELRENPDKRAMETMLLAKALDHTARARKIDTDLILRLQKEVAAKAAAKVKEVAREGGLTADQQERLYKEVLRIVA